MHALGSRTLGFAQELFDQSDLGPGVAAIFTGGSAAADYPSLTAVISAIHHDEDAEFAFGLDLVLDGLERAEAAR